MLDVLIAGAGPAGSIAALVLARAGARVVVIDPDEFPRDKLCGDILNPGAVSRLASLGLVDGPFTHARRLSGMRVTGPHASVSSLYGRDQTALVVSRRDLDTWLLGEAVRAGARFEPRIRARRALVDEGHRVPVVRGLVLARRGQSGELRMPATLTIAADGCRSRVARSVGLSKPIGGPSRWGFGAYVSHVTEMNDVSEIHIRARRYVGLAPVSDARVNVCVVTGPRPEGRCPLEVIERVIASDRRLAARFGRAVFDGPVRVLGPLAADITSPGVEGLLVAGDAAGFIDPLTGDGLRLAIDGAVLAAEEALTALESGAFSSAAGRLAERRQAAFGSKQRFTRMLRRLVNSPVAVDLASLGARLAPGVVRRAICYAGDLP